MKGFKITNLITNIIAFLYSFLFCGLIGGFSLLELFVGSWGKNDEAISESLILLLSSAVIILHGFLLVIFGGYAYSKWKNNPKPYLKCHLFLSISGICSYVRKSVARGISSSSNMGENTLSLSAVPVSW